VQAYQTCDLTGLRVRVARRSSWALVPVAMRVGSFEISLGNPRCTGRSLVCLMNWARPHFQSFEFSVGDTLRVYNYMTLGHPDFGRLGLTEATEIAALEGEVWHRANATAIGATLGEQAFRVLFWEDWKKHADFGDRLTRLVDLFGTSAVFRDYLLADIAAYVRRQGNGSVCLSAAEMELLATYMLEELAVYQLQAEARPTVNIYPGGMPKVVRALGTIAGMPRVLAMRHYAYVDMHERHESAIDAGIDANVPGSAAGSNS